MSRPCTRISAWHRPFAPHVTRPSWRSHGWGADADCVALDRRDDSASPFTASVGGTSTGVGWPRSGIGPEWETRWSGRTTNAEPRLEAGADAGGRRLDAVVAGDLS
jgi:hypothetical protein